LKPPWINDGVSCPVFTHPTLVSDIMSLEINVNAIEATALPETGDTAYYRSAVPQARKLLVTVTEIFKNGRIKVEFPDGRWKSLPRKYHKRVQNQQYGLVRID
jgi:hypothetical protein